MDMKGLAKLPTFKSVSTAPREAPFASLGRMGRISLPSSGNKGVLSVSPISLNFVQLPEPLSTWPASLGQRVTRETRG